MYRYRFLFRINNPTELTVCDDQTFSRAPLLGHDDVTHMNGTAGVVRVPSLGSGTVTWFLIILQRKHNRKQTGAQPPHVTELLISHWLGPVRDERGKHGARTIISCRIPVQFLPRVQLDSGATRRSSAAADSPIR